MAPAADADSRSPALASHSLPPSPDPVIRVVVVNYNGGAMTLRCLDEAARSEWPPDRLELVLVDNASDDGVAAAAEQMPRVRVIRSPSNLGFSGGVNLGLRDLAGVDYVALLNNDAFPDPGWLAPLVEAIEAHDRVGAACPKILFADRFVEIDLVSPPFRPGGADPRLLGVRVSGARVDGTDAWERCQFPSGFFGQELDPGRGETFRWAGPAATVRVPVGPEPPGPDRDPGLLLRLEAEDHKRVSVGGSEVEVGPDPRWVEAGGWRPSGDVVNNVGLRIVAGGRAGDRGFLELDEGQYDQPAAVFGWCGAAALLSRSYLADVGTFDDRLFLYYEDVDLSWRGLLRGWEYRYVPASTVRHLHSATAGEGSALFTHFVDRNRLVVWARNAPASMVADALWQFARESASMAVRDVVDPLRRRRPVVAGPLLQKARALGGFCRLLPDTLASRRSQRGRPDLDRHAVRPWVETR